MSVLFDESMPRPLRRDIIGHEVQTVRQLGWAGTRNGELLRLAAAAGFKATVMMDQNMEFQQNLAEAGLGVVVVQASSNRLDDLRPLARQIVAVLDRIDPGQVVHVGEPPGQRRPRGQRRRSG